MQHGDGRILLRIHLISLEWLKFDVASHEAWVTMHQIGVFKRDLTYVYFWKCHLSKLTKQDMWAARCFPYGLTWVLPVTKCFERSQDHYKCSKFTLPIQGLSIWLLFFGRGTASHPLILGRKKNRNFGDHRGEQLPLAGYFWLAYFRYHHFGVQKTGQNLPTFYHHSLLRGLNPRGKESTFNEKGFTTQKYQKIAHLSLAATPPPKQKKKTHTHTPPCGQHMPA